MCVQKLFEDKNYIDGFSKDAFHEILTVTMTKSFILFHNEYYRQHKGEAMGLAWKCLLEFKPVIYISQIEKFKYYLNLQHANIKFTSEIEMNNLLSVLDIKIIRKNKKLKIENLKNIFRKNGYPVNFTDFCIKKYLGNLCIQKSIFVST